MSVPLARFLRPTITLGLLCASACVAVRALRTEARENLAADEQAQRFLDRPAGIAIHSNWDPEVLASEPERGLVPMLEVGFESGIPDAAAVPPRGTLIGRDARSREDAEVAEVGPRVVAEAAAEGNLGLRFDPAAGALCFAVSARPEVSYLLEVSGRRTFDPRSFARDADPRTAERLVALAQVGKLVVLEFSQPAPRRERLEEFLGRVANSEIFFLASHSIDLAQDSFRRERLRFRTTARSRCLLLVLMGGTPGWWLSEDAIPGAVPPGSVDFDRLQLTELPLERHLAMEQRSCFGTASMSGDTRRALIAPAGMRVEIPLFWPERRCRLSFSYAVLEEQRPDWGRTPIRFTARLERDGGESLPLLARDVTPRRPDSASGSGESEERYWREFVHESVGDGRAARLVLETSSPGETHDVAVFAEPKLEPLLEPAELPPDVVLISLDTLRHDRLGCSGYRLADGRSPTPSLDEFAARSLRFTAARSLAPWTLPSHATMFTGLAPPVHRVTRVGRRLVPEVHPLIAVEFARAGYATAAFTAGANVAPDSGFAAGFDRYTVVDPVAVELDLDRDLSERQWSQERAQGLRERFGVTAAMQWIEAQAGRPCFLFLHTYVIHNYRFDDPRLGLDLKPTPELAELASKLYDARLALTDGEIGELLKWLAARGRLGRTVVAIVSDHGEEFAEHGGIGHGTSLYEELLRVPFLLHVPGVEPNVVDEVVDLTDLAPTLREAAGLTAVAACDGESVLARLREDSFREAFWSEVGPANMGRERALRLGRFKLVLRPPDLPENSARRDQRPAAWELYDLEADPFEKRNLLPVSADASWLESRDELPESVRAIGRRFRHELEFWRARRDELVPDPVRLSRSVSEETKRHLIELGYATDETVATDDDE